VGGCCRRFENLIGCERELVFEQGSEFLEIAIPQVGRDGADKNFWRSGAEGLKDGVAAYGIAENPAPNHPGKRVVMFRKLDIRCGFSTSRFGKSGEFCGLVAAFQTALQSEL
jgi:hypothetical protein